MPRKVINFFGLQKYLVLNSTPLQGHLDCVPPHASIPEAPNKHFMGLPKRYRTCNLNFGTLGAE